MVIAQSAGARPLPRQHAEATSPENKNQPAAEARSAGASKNASPSPRSPVETSAQTRTNDSTKTDGAHRAQQLISKVRQHGGLSVEDTSKASQSKSLHSDTTATTDKHLFKRLPGRLQGLFALGLLSDQKATQAKVLASAQASARQVQLLLPLLKQDKNFTSAQLIKQPPTLLKLDLSGHQLLAVSRQPFNTADTVNLRLDSQGRLHVSAQSLTESATQNLSKLNASHEVNTTSRTLSHGSSRQLNVQQALREALPQQQKLSTVLSQVQNLSNNLNMLPRGYNLLNATSRLMVDQLSDRLPSLAQLSQTSGLKQAVQLSGIGKEAQLAKLSVSGQVQSAAGPTTSTALLPSNPLGSMSALMSTSSSATINTTINTASDVKTLLGKLAQSLRNDVQLHRLRESAHSTSQGSAKTINPRLSSDINAMLEQLLNPQSALIAKSQSALMEQFKQLKGPQLQLLREQIKQKLINLSQSGIAKVQTQQLNMLSEPATGVLQRWLMELPFSFQGSVHSIEIEIQKREPQKKKDTSKTLDNQWQLRLNIDLKDLGILQADVKLIADRGNIQLWFAQPEALTLAQNQLKRLRESLTQQGIELEELRCHQGIPPKLETSLQFQLINTQA